MLLVSKEDSLSILSNIKHSIKNIYGGCLPLAEFVWIAQVVCFPVRCTRQNTLFYFFKKKKKSTDITFIRHSEQKGLKSQGE